MDDGVNIHEAFSELYNGPWTSAELIVSVIKGVLLHLHQKNFTGANHAAIGCCYSQKIQQQHYYEKHHKFLYSSSLVHIKAVKPNTIKISKALKDALEISMLPHPFENHLNWILHFRT